MMVSATALAQSPSRDGVVVETTRAAPIVAIVEQTATLVQGTSERGAAVTTVQHSSEVAAFRFPATLGHVRGFATNQISQHASYADHPALFDTASMIPPVSYTGCGRFDSSCRSVFTTVAPGSRPARVLLEEKSLSSVGPMLASGAALSTADQRVIMQRVLAGREVAPGKFVPALGGVDRSSVAVIPTSPMTGVERPTMIYVGASDGMLHAFCGSVKAGSCDRVGRELWAYIPRTSLGALRTHTATVDGSPHVVEVMGDFASAGRRSLHTILLFSTGSSGSVYALDITNPANPTVAWEYVSRDIAGTSIATGRVQLMTGPKYFAYVPTSAGITALDIETGRVAWTITEQGVGGVAVTVKKGQVEELVFGTARGELWVVDAMTGANRRKGPAFRFSQPGHPFASAPAIYTNADGETYALAVSGAPKADRTQYAIAISLTARPNPSPLDEESADSTRLPIVLAFDERTSSRALVVGNQGVGSPAVVFATASKAYRVSFVTNTIATADIPEGAQLSATSTGLFATGLTSFGRVELAMTDRAAHTVSSVPSDDDSSWY
ncbi:MAG: hypothetical protein ACKV2T_15025 [Kofleriaceae bacterium]